MAKVTYTKLGLNKLIPKNKEVFEFNEQQIEITKYLPIDEKVELIQRIVNNSLNADEKIINPCKVNVYLYVEMVLAYTNITLTETQRKDLNKIYDGFCGSGFMWVFRAHMSDKEWGYIENSVWEILENMIKYRSSALGILDTVSQDYSTLDLDAVKIQQELNDPNNMGFLRNVLEKLG